jgi:Uncharacterized protein conserved in bacteria (DUF2188)
MRQLPECQIDLAQDFFPSALAAFVSTPIERECPEPGVPLEHTFVSCGEVEMSNPNNRHVVPDGNGGWDVVAPGAERVSGHFPTQDEAYDRAREIVTHRGGGEVVIHDRHGRIRNSNTIGRPDPDPPRDTRH